jgi:signal transduction histidine kinase
MRQPSGWAIAALTGAADNQEATGSPRPVALPVHVVPRSPVSPRRFDPALWLSTAIAAAVVVASLVVHGELVAHDGRQRRDATGSTAEAVSARLEGSLRNLLSTLETAAASPPAGLEQRTATLRTRGTVTAVARVQADGHTPTVLVGDAAAFDPGTIPVLNAARDTGEARLERSPGRTGLLAVAPVYRGLPRGTADRRNLVDGYVLAAVDVGRLLRDSLPPDVAANVSLSDDADVVGTVGEAARPGARARQVVEAGGRAYQLTLTGPAEPARFPALPLCATGLALLTWGAAVATVRARRRAEQSASVRGEELSLLANLGALLQGSLDLEVILPAAALRLSEQLRLDGFAVLRADRRGRLVHAFSLDAAPSGDLAGVADIGPSPDEVAAGTDALFPLQRAGRVTGALWLRPRRALDRPTVRSIHAAADLMAAALTNADAFDQERETVRRLEDLDRIKNRFIGTVSHEMRTSASAISGFASLLSSRWERLEDGERRDLVTRIDRNGQSLVSVVEDFLDFSRLERRSPASDPPPDSLSDLVATAVEDLASLAPRHRLVTRIAPDVAAFVDRAAVERILTNLVSNAAKYSPAGTQITIAVDPVGDTAVLAVEDEGSGIPPAERERVFEAFYRAAHQSVAGTHGAGIGLAVVKEVVDRLRARVSVEDSPAGGARLVVSFRGASTPVVPRPALVPGGPDEH